MENISHIIFLPYRDREEELKIFYNNMVKIFDEQIGKNKYKMIVLHQLDKKLFNKGAILNSGFVWFKKLYPNIYKDLILINHDIDIYVKKTGIINYNCNDNEVKHPYGEKYENPKALLGCFNILKFKNYELVGGYPNYYGWGSEDTCFGQRCIAKNLYINEENFIYRRQHQDIVDPDSHPSPKQKQFCYIQNKRNMNQLIKENFNNPDDTFKKVDYIVEKIYHPFTNEEIINKNDEVKKYLEKKENNILMLDVNFNIRC